jgi:hypothetical protein
MSDCAVTNSPSGVSTHAAHAAGHWPDQECARPTIDPTSQLRQTASTVLAGR